MKDSSSIPELSFYPKTAVLLLLVLQGTRAAADSTTVPLHWIPRVRISQHVPMGHAHSHWEPYSCAGAYLTCPTSVAGLSLTAGGEGGILTSRESPRRERLLFEFSTVCGYTPGPLRGRFRLSPFVGLANVMVYRSRKLVFDSDVFSPSESEFAATAGLEPSVTIGRVRLTVPLWFSYTFSAPHPFVSLAAAVDIGGIL